MSNKLINKGYVEILKLGRYPHVPTDEEVQRIVDDESISNFDLCFPMRSGYSAYTSEKYWAGYILAKRGYPYVKDVLFYLFIWMQDTNWPGASEVREIIEENVNNPFVRKVGMLAIKVAKAQKDDEWLEHLEWILGINEESPAYVIVNN